MRLYVDTEFNGFGGQLISMAVVSEDGREWYEVLPLPESIDPWVAKNVIPCLAKAPIDEMDWRLSLHDFLKQFDEPTVVADWYTDLVHFFGSFQGRDHAETFAYSCKAELVVLDTYESEIPHNALSDARAIKNSIMKARAG
ncbi:hypothetical protein [Agrobacterium cavarae]|uniref:hypothetical protein n=1 Tax=Agrobacterium cavarae TaxID=2528239 RepID=UPI00289EBFF3|nr:hypothetical protein [Agrobacterium cavarae]